LLNRKPRCANIHKGVNTFAFSTRSSIVATAGSDKISSSYKTYR